VVSSLGLGDEKDEEHYETKWNDWLPELWNELGTPPPSMELLDPSYSVSVEDKATTAVPHVIVPPGMSTATTILWPVYVTCTRTHNDLMAFCTGLPGWASTRRNIHPLTPF